MNAFPVPEILRIPLESISLTVKVMREDEDVQASYCVSCPRVQDLNLVFTALFEESD